MATISDVAKLAGLSVGTVSRVFNNRGYISDQTRNKVADACKQLNYYPSEIARSLQRGRYNVIGVVVPYIFHPFFAELVQVIEEECFKIGYKIMLCNSNHEPDKEREYTEMLRRNQVDGIIMSSRTQDTSCYRNLGLPIVSVERILEDSIPAIVSDNQTGGILAADALIDRGCRKPLFIGPIAPKNSVADERKSIPSLLRDKAFFDRCAQRGVTAEIEPHPIDIYSQDATEAFAQLISRHSDIDGIFAPGDVQAMYILNACEGILGLRVPDDIQIVGYDNTKCSMYCGISTVAQPIAEMGRRAVSMLINRIEGEECHSSVMLPVEFVERRTTKSILS